MTTDLDGYKVYNTSAANMIAAVAYLQSTQLSEGDPRAAVHREAMEAANAGIALGANRLPPPDIHPTASLYTTATTSSWQQSGLPSRCVDSPPRRPDPRNARDDLVQAQVDRA